MNEATPKTFEQKVREIIYSIGGVVGQDDQGNEHIFLDKYKIVDPNAFISKILEAHAEELREIKEDLDNLNTLITMTNKSPLETIGLWDSEKVREIIDKKIESKHENRTGCN